MLKVLNHPLITHKLAQMRKVETGTKDFRQNLDEIAGLMAYEICRDLPTKPVTIQTPICEWFHRHDCNFVRPSDYDKVHACRTSRTRL